MSSGAEERQVSRFGDDRACVGLAVAVMVGLAALLHVVAAWVHRDHATLAGLFLIAAVLQLAWAGALLFDPRPWVIAAGAVVNGSFVVFYVLTRMTGLTDVQGLEQAQPVGFQDGVTTLLEVAAVGGAVLMLSPGLLARGLPVRVTPRVLTVVSVLAVLFAVPAFAAGTAHDHAAHDGHDHAAGDHAHGDDDHDHSDGDHADGDHDDGGHAHADGDHADDDHGHDDGHETHVAGTVHGHGDGDHAHAGDPGHHEDHGDHGPGHAPGHGPGHGPSGGPGHGPGHDHSGDDPGHDHGEGSDDGHDHGDDPSDPGFPAEWTVEQVADAEQLIADTERGLQQFADPSVLSDLGFIWIGDGAQPGGYQHWINVSWFSDTLDPDRPGSLVFLNTGDGLELQAAMYMLPLSRNLSNIPADIAWLPGWHVHDNLCFGSGLQLAGLTDANGQCPAGSTQIDTPPMLHVWIVDTECGRFAGVDENGLQCDHEHDGGSSEPGFPDDWTAEQVTSAEQLIADTERALPQFADPSNLPDGFHWIGDGNQPGGYQHWVNMNWFDDEHILDPEYPESLVYRNTGNGLVLEAAMFILPWEYDLSNIPADIAWLPGWHIHDNLCFRANGTLAGLARNGVCASGFLVIPPPMTHVWLVDTGCGRFAGVDEHGLQCDHEH